jgi:NADH-quinone oxidoreductase subunit J
MTPVMILFLVIAIITLGAALMVVTARNLVHVALWLIVSLFGVAVMFAILSAGFLAVAQVVVYIGAIAILLIFAIMLTRRVNDESRAAFNANWRWAVLIGFIFFAGLLAVLLNWPGLTTTPSELDARANQVIDMGLALVDPAGYLLAFELASVLLLAAMVGAIYVAWDRRKS